MTCVASSKIIRLFCMKHNTKPDAIACVNLNAITHVLYVFVYFYIFCGALFLEMFQLVYCKFLPGTGCSAVYRSQAPSQIILYLSSFLFRGLHWTSATCQWSRPLPTLFTSKASSSRLLPSPIRLCSRAPSIKGCSNDQQVANSSNNSTSLCPRCRTSHSTSIPALWVPFETLVEAGIWGERHFYKCWLFLAEQKSTKSCFYSQYNSMGAFFNDPFMEQQFSGRQSKCSSYQVNIDDPEVDSDS